MTVDELIRLLSAYSKDEEVYIDDGETMTPKSIEEVVRIKVSDDDANGTEKIMICMY